MVTNGTLTTIDTRALATAPGHRLREDAAKSFDRLAAACVRRYGWVPRLTDSYRSLATQERIFKARYVRQATGGGYYGDVRRWNGARYVRRRGYAAAAIPGRSNHGWGLAVDCTDLANAGFTGTRYKQLVALGAGYGWTNTEGRKVGESWHLGYTPSLDRHKTAAVPTSAWPRGVYGYGSTGAPVKRLQAGLNRVQNARLVPDGQFGGASETAVKTYQRTHRLTPDGIAGPLTRARLKMDGVTV